MITPDMTPEQMVNAIPLAVYEKVKAQAGKHRITPEFLVRRGASSQVPGWDKLTRVQQDALIDVLKGRRELPPRTVE